MNLYYWKSDCLTKNFGDELNPYIWPKVLNFAANDDHIDFVGIGTLLNEKLSRENKKIIFGSGVGYGKNTLTIDETFDIRFVRGPLSAKKLNISPDLSITDSAIFLKNIYQCKSQETIYEYSYMPHWQNSGSLLRNLCEEAGIHYIDPTQSNIENILEEICNTDTLFTEAMHGAIIADTYDVPWVPIISTDEILQFKWLDWCASVKVDFHPSSITAIWDPSKQNIIKKTVNSIKKKMIIDQFNRIKRKGIRHLSNSNHRNHLLGLLNREFDKMKQQYDI